MKFILLILLIANLYCSVYYIKKYERSPKIKDYSGLVVLDLIEFKEGDSIYITYNTYEGKYHDYIYYNFSNSYPDFGDPQSLKNYIYCYSNSYTEHKHNVSDGYGGYYIYYTYDYYYYFEFTMPNNNTRYLIMGYDLSRSKAYYLYVDNTRFNRWVTTLIIVGSVAGAILIGAIIFVIWKYHDSISCGCFSSLFSCLSCLCCRDCCHKTYSYDISSTNNYENKSDKLLDPIPSTSTNSKEVKTEEKPALVELPNSNYNADEVPEQPYYMKDNQNPPQGDPQNDDVGYNSQIYNGGGGIYQ